MTKHIKLIILMLGVALSATAQNTNSAYFLDGYLFRYQMNPAIGNAQNFVAMPGVGNVNVSQRGTLAMTDVLYNVGGKTTTFLNPEVSASEVMGNLKNNNRTSVDLSLELISFGFKGLKGYNTVSISTRSNAAVRVPKDLFRLLKEGASNDTYDISNVNAHADAFAEVALNHSHAISRNVRIGATLKALVGMGNLDADFNTAQLALGEDSWTATTDAKIQTNMKGFSYKTSVNDRTGHEYVSGADIDFSGVSGFGVAVDLGVVATLKDFEISAAVLDLGMINWSNTYVASTNGRQTFTTDRYTFNVDGDAPNNFDDELDRIGDDLSALYELTDMGDKGSRTRMLASTINLGVKYTLPTYKALSFGLLNTTRLQGDFTWTEFRASANYAPSRLFSMGVSAAAGTNGMGLGWMLNLHPNGFNLFAGMDYANFRLAKQGVPLSSNTAVNVGINFPF